MPHEPKRRHSTQRKGKRRASIHLAVKMGITCPNCTANMIPHRVCKTCGYYKGREVIVKKQKKTTEQPAATA